MAHCCVSGSTLSSSFWLLPWLRYLVTWFIICSRYFVFPTSLPSAGIHPSRKRTELATMLALLSALILALAGASAPAPAAGNLTLPKVLGSHMILQRAPKKVETVAEYKARLRRTALALPKELVTKAVGSMPKKIKEVRDAKGGSIKSD